MTTHPVYGTFPKKIPARLGSWASEGQRRNGSVGGSCGQLSGLHGGQQRRHPAVNKRNIGVLSPSRCPDGRRTDAPATGRLRVGGRRRADAVVGHALIASNGPRDSLTRDVPTSMGVRLPPARLLTGGHNEDLSAR